MPTNFVCSANCPEIRRCKSAAEKQIREIRSAELQSFDSAVSWENNGGAFPQSYMNTMFMDNDLKIEVIEGHVIAREAVLKATCPGKPGSKFFGLVAVCASEEVNK